MHVHIGKVTWATACMYQSGDNLEELVLCYIHGSLGKSGMLNTQGPLLNGGDKIPVVSSNGSLSGTQWPRQKL